ncbi:hypothetical protein HJC23_009283 [Cyclotella cryptica]|uniref:Peptidase M12B domain-containing protein n=1 Tax=Cyclotella cryptica TaxID=29204 RepID=A0ABD3QSD5_9STRA|eukprot:CCRYP_002253-RA/>CCRYP_002253-RA protein AED:0.18 eAED:0.18 QI:119/1/1/1/0.44/0.5/10/2012/747
MTRRNIDIAPSNNHYWKLDTLSNSKLSQPIMIAMLKKTVAFFLIAPAGAVIPQQRPRRILKPDQNLAEQFRSTADAGGFTIAAEIQDNEHETFAGTTDTRTILIDVVKVNTPAVTPDTVIERDGKRSLVEYEKLNTLLVSDTSTSRGRESFALLSFDPRSEDWYGIVDSDDNGGYYKVGRKKGGTAQAMIDMAGTPPVWECAVGDDFTVDEDGHRRRSHTHGRFLRHEEELGIEHEQKNHQYDLHETSAMKALTEALQEANIDFTNKQPVFDAAGSYSYQVDLFIEIDNEFIQNSGNGDFDTALNYVNALVTAANVVFEKEIDTHLHVAHLLVSDLYVSASGTKEALDIMRNNYGSESWHTPGIDLHHALLGKALGGGIAYIGVLCRGDYGYGLTSSISGEFTNLDHRVVWDLKAFMHEIGHSFSSGHTHDEYYYEPAIDSCGTTCPTLPGFKWSTIMSYCQHCPGDFSNLMYSFGGTYDGFGVKSDFANWMDNPDLVANYDASHMSIDPRRASYQMFVHVSSRPNNCLSVPVENKQTRVHLTATYDVDLAAPKCSAIGVSCSSGDLLFGRGIVGPGESGNAPNNLDNCKDGTIGTYNSDESMESIKISSINGNLLRAGDRVEVEAVVYVWDPAQDFADFYYTSNATNPLWVLIGTIKPAGSGMQTIKTQFDLVAGSLQAVRINFRYQGSTSICSQGEYDDIDDLVFPVAEKADGATPTPSPRPTTKWISKSSKRMGQDSNRVEEYI